MIVFFRFLTGVSVFIGTGERFDEFERFEAPSFVQRLLGMGDVKGYVLFVL
jgi:signal recognition particle GTPase